MRHRALKIYNKYPRQVARGRAIPAIYRAIAKLKHEVDDPWGFLEDKVTEFTDCFKYSDKHHLPYCATWMDDERYHDDKSEWSL